MSSDLFGASGKGPALWVPKHPANPLIATLGFEVAAKQPADLWPKDSVATYIIASEYMSPLLEGMGSAYETLPWTMKLLMMFPRDEMLQALASMNQICNSRDLQDELRRRVPERFAPDLAAAIEAVLQGQGAGGVPRALLARPVLLRTMRLVAQASPPDEAARQKGIAEGKFESAQFDLLDAALLLTHAVADHLGASPGSEGYPADGPTLGGLPEELALAMVCNGALVERENPGDLLGRTRLLYVEYGGQIAKVTPRAPVMEMLEEALGMPLDQALAIGFGFHALLEGNNPFESVPKTSSFLDIMDVPESSWLRFLQIFSQTPDQLTEASLKDTGEWAMGPLQQRPLLRLNDDVVILDEHYLFERFTTGLYWLIFDNEKSHGVSENNEEWWRRWTQVYGEMHELLVEDFLRDFAPPLLDGKSSMFFEDDIGAAFGGKRADASIDFGSSILIVDAQGGQLTTGTREQGSVKSFKADLDRLVLDKAKQLDETATCLLIDPQPPKSPLRSPAPRILPAVVPGGPFPNNPVTSEYIREQAVARQLLTDRRIRPLAVLDLRDIQHAAAVRAHESISLEDMILGWQDSAYAAVSLSNWLSSRDVTGAGQPRPAGKVLSALDEGLTLIQALFHEPTEP